MPAVTMARLMTDLQSLYSPPVKAIATWRKMRQALEEVERLAHVKKSSDLTVTAVADWLKHAPQRSPATTRTLLSSFRRACAYAKHRGWLRASPFEFRKLADWQPDYDPDEDDDEGQKHHPLADIRKVLLYLRGESVRGWEEHRLFAIAATFAYTGARAREVQCAQVATLDLVEHSFHIRKNERLRLKTKKSKRDVPLHSGLVPILIDWLGESGSIWAFPGVRRKSPWEGGSKGKKPLDQLKAAGLACGVEGFTAQSLRHSFVTHSAAAGIPELLTQQMCGHTQKKTTKGYRHKDQPNLRIAMECLPYGDKLLPAFATA
jgi:integrase